MSRPWTASAWAKLGLEERRRDRPPSWSWEIPEVWITGIEGIVDKSRSSGRRQQGFSDVHHVRIRPFIFPEPARESPA